MNGARVLQVMGFILLGLGVAGVAFLISNDAQPVMWLGAVGPTLMGVALLVISRTIRKERE
jgi:hypothetical protein